MKSSTTSKAFPDSDEAWQAILDGAAAPQHPEAPSNLPETSAVVVVKSGGYQAVHDALTARRRQGERGPQKSPTKQAVTIRYSPEVLAYFKATGAGWQGRMNEALIDWVSRHPAEHS